MALNHAFLQCNFHNLICEVRLTSFCADFLHEYTFYSLSLAYDLSTIFAIRWLLDIIFKILLIFLYYSRKIFVLIWWQNIWILSQCNAALRHLSCFYIFFGSNARELNENLIFGIMLPYHQYKKQNCVFCAEVLAIRNVTQDEG